MQWSQAAVGLAGLAGAAVATAHGFVMQRSIVRPLQAHFKTTRVLSRTLERLVAPLLHVSTLAWFLGGIALMVVSREWQDPLRPLITVLVGILYSYAALLNAIATRGRHFGWMVMAAAVLLLVAAALNG